MARTKTIFARCEETTWADGAQCFSIQQVPVPCTVDKHPFWNWTQLWGSDAPASQKSPTAFYFPFSFRTGPWYDRSCWSSFGIGPSFQKFCDCWVSRPCGPELAHFRTRKSAYRLAWHCRVNLRRMRQRTYLTTYLSMEARRKSWVDLYFWDTLIFEKKSNKILHFYVFNFTEALDCYSDQVLHIKIWKGIAYPFWRYGWKIRWTYTFGTHCTYTAFSATICILFSIFYAILKAWRNL